MALVCLWRGLSSCCDRPRQMVPLPAMLRTLQNTFAVTLQLFLPGSHGTSRGILRQTAVELSRGLHETRRTHRVRTVYPTGPLRDFRENQRDPM